MPNTTYTNNNYQLPVSAATQELTVAPEYAGHPQPQVSAPHCDPGSVRGYYQPMEPPPSHQGHQGHMHPAAVDPSQHRADMYRGYERGMHMRANGNHQQYYAQPQGPAIEMTPGGDHGAGGYPDPTMAEQYRTHSPSQYQGARYMPCKMQEGGMNGGVPNGMPEGQYMQTQQEAAAADPMAGQQGPQVMYGTGGQPPPAVPQGPQSGGAGSPNVLFPWMRTQFGE